MARVRVRVRVRVGVRVRVRVQLVDLARVWQLNEQEGVALMHGLEGR